AAALRLSRALGANRLDVEDLRTGAGEGTRRLRESIALLAVLSPDALLAIDHLGPLLSALSVQHRLELLGTLRASRQGRPGAGLGDHVPRSHRGRLAAGRARGLAAAASTDRANDRAPVGATSPGPPPRPAHHRRDERRRATPCNRGKLEER